MNIFKPMTLEFTDVPDPEFELPKYSDVGAILVNVLDADADSQFYEVLDSSGCTFWIDEGVGFDYWLADIKDEFPKNGTYVIRNVVGYFIKGEWGYTDDDEDWEHDPAELVSDSITTLAEIGL